MVELEDWVRESAPRAEFVTRAETVARPGRSADRVPGSTTHAWCASATGTVVVPETQAQLVGLLVERFGETVADARDPGALRRRAV